ncbi:MAG: HEAT repeat domain-containing protein, partial [Elusimicrobia bacterium]|nr:HEAT repeat domain-containing protein [Elusimicrobiota bacterium]
MSAAILAVALLWPAPRARAASPVLLPGMLLPGYASVDDEAGAPDPRAAAPQAAFPKDAARFADADDPLAALGADPDLRDAVASPPSGAWLMARLRSPLTAERLRAIREASIPRDLDGVPALSATMLRLDEPASVRAAAALALGRIGDEIAVPSLAAALKDPAPEVRYAAALSLGRIPVEGVATRLERVLRLDPDWRPRYAALIGLGRSRKSFVEPDLARALATDPAWQVRQQAARSLADLGDRRGAAALEKALRDREPSVRAAAGASLAAL